MSRLFASLTELYEKSGINSSQFMAASKDACKQVETERKKRSKLTPSGDGILPTEITPSKPKGSAYTDFMGNYLHNYKGGNSHIGMKEGANYWNNGGKEEWLRNHK
jgi:hypothetical protein